MKIMKTKLNLEKAVSKLQKKHDCKIDLQKKEILILKNKVADKKNKIIFNPFKYFDLGNKSWGTIDYLVKVHMYDIIWVREF